MAKRLNWNRARPGYGGRDVVLGSDWRRSAPHSGLVIGETDDQAATRRAAEKRKKLNSLPHKTKRDPARFKAAFIETYGEDAFRQYIGLGRRK